MLHGFVMVRMTAMMEVMKPCVVQLKHQSQKVRPQK